MSVSVPSSFTPLPAQPTRLEIESAALRYVGMPNSPDARQSATDGLKDCINRINQRSWRMLETYFDITFTVGIADYSLPRDVRSERALELLDSDNGPRGTMEFKDPKTFKIEHPDVLSSSNPRVYTISSYQQDGLLSLNVYPDQAFVDSYPTGRFWYRRTVLHPSPAEIVDVGPAYYSFVEWYVKWYTAMDHAPARSSKAAEMWRNAEKQLKVEDNEFQDWAEVN